ncbi:hypothetical protein GHT89_16620 [Acinetobacter baumannii]|uniref:hypothetical protein n=1 Tax=Acinetobacter baumannii TaxID=470 RepID=UPI00387DC468
MDNLNILIGMMYGDWFIILLYMFLGISPLILLRPKILNQKRFFSILFGVVSLVLILFYFVIPVPDSVQEREIKFIQGFKANNNAPKMLNLELAMEQVCGAGYLKAYQYFILVNAFRLDSEIAFKSQKILTFGGNEDFSYTEKKICDLKKNLNSGVNYE